MGTMIKMGECLDAMEVKNLAVFGTGPAALQEVTRHGKCF